MPVMVTSRPALSHVAFACRDLDATHRFYTEVIGLRLIHTDVSRFDEPGIPDEPDVALALLTAGPEDAAPPKPVRAG